MRVLREVFCDIREKVGKEGSSVFADDQIYVVPGLYVYASASLVRRSVAQTFL
jgi:hypothetical protein